HGPHGSLAERAVRRRRDRWRYPDLLRRPLRRGRLMQAGWSSWNLDPFLVGSLVLAGSLYLSGGIHIRRRARQGVGVAGWRMLVFGLGLLAIFVALVSPVDALSEELFSVHMVQHLL